VVSRDSVVESGKWMTNLAMPTPVKRADGAETMPATTS
jgi:hypothetical protein